MGDMSAEDVRALQEKVAATMQPTPLFYYTPQAQQPSYANGFSIHWANVSHGLTLVFSFMNDRSFEFLPSVPTSQAHYRRRHCCCSRAPGARPPPLSQRRTRRCRHNHCATAIQPQQHLLLSTWQHAAAASAGVADSAVSAAAAAAAAVGYRFVVRAVATAAAFAR